MTPGEADRQRAEVEFEVEWATGRRPGAAGFAADRYPAAGPDLVRGLVVVEFRCHWRYADPLPVEVFLRTRHPDRKADPDLVLDLIRAEIALHPGAPDPADYADRFPHLAGPIAAEFRARAEVSANWASDPYSAGHPPEQTVDGHPVPPAGPPPPAAGTEFAVEDRYAVTRAVGEGGYKRVFEAVQRNAGRPVAVKVPRTAAGAGPVLAEGRVLARLDHQYIPAVVTVGTTRDGQALVAERLIRGTDWRTELVRQRAERAGVPPGPARDALARAHLRANLATLLDVCKALRYAHDGPGLIHRDVKPENVMLGGYGEVYLVDWGLAVHVGPAPDPTARAPHRSAADPRCGTPAYMAPEMARGQADRLSPATDVFLLGATLYHALTGRPPYRDPAAGPGQPGNVVVVVNLAQTGARPPVAAIAPDPVPPELAAVVERAMAFDPAARYPDAAGFSAAVQAYLDHADAEDQLGRTAAAHAALTARLAADRSAGRPLHPHITPLIEVADQYRVAAAAFGAAGPPEVAAARGRAVAGERAARLELVELAEASAAFPLAESQLDRVEALAAPAADLARRRAKVRRAAARARRTKWLFRGAALTAAGLFAAVVWLEAARRVGRIEVAAAEDRRQAEKGRADAAAKQLAAEAALREQADRIARSLPRFEAADAAGRAGLTQAAAGNLAAALAVYDTPGPRRAWLGAIQRSLVPVAAAPTRVATGSLAYSPDGSRLVSGDLDRPGHLRVWDLPSGELLRTLPGHPPTDEPDGLSAVRRLVFHPGEPTVVVSAGLDGTVRLSNVATGASVRQSAPTAGVQILSVDISPRPAAGGYRIVTGDTAKRVVLWDAATLTPIRELAGHADAVTAVRFAPGGTHIASGGRDGGVRLWDADGSPADQFDAHTGRPQKAINDLAFTAGDRLAVAGAHPDIQIWDIHAKTKTHTLKGHTAGPHGRDWVLRLTVGPAGALFSTGDDGTVREWDAAAGTAVAVRGRHDPDLSDFGTAVAAAVRPDGTELATSGADGGVRRWDAKTGTLTAELRGQPRRGFGTSVAGWCPKTGRLLTAGLHGAATARLWDATALTPVREYRLLPRTDDGIDRLPTAGAFSPDGKTFYLGYANGELVEVETDANPVRVKHVWKTGHGRNPLVGAAAQGLEAARLLGVDASPDGKRLATVGADFTLKVWDAAARTLARTIPLLGKGFTVKDLSFQLGPHLTADGRFAVTLGGDGAIRRWNLDTGELAETVRGHTSPLMAGRFSPDGRLFASGSDGLVVVWDAATWEPVRTVPLPAVSGQFRGEADDGDPALRAGYRAQGKAIGDVAFSPDRRLLAATQLDGSVAVIDVAAGVVLYRGTGHTAVRAGPGASLACGFTPAGRLRTAAENGEVFDWDVARLPGVVADLRADSVRSLVPSADRTAWAWTESFVAGTAPAGPDGLPAFPAGGPLAGWYGELADQWPTATAHSAEMDETAPLRLPTVKPGTLRDVPHRAAFAGGTGRLVVGNRYGTATVVDPAGPAVVATFTPPARTPLWVERMAREKRLLAATEDLDALAVDPAGELAATNSGAAAVDLWRVADGKLVHTFDLAGRRATGLAFRPAGRPHLAAALDDGRLLVWDVPSRRAVASSPPVARGGRVAYSPDGTRLARFGFGPEVILLDADTGAEVQRLTGQREVAMGAAVAAAVNDAAFSPDGGLLATCGLDGAVWVARRSAAGRYEPHLFASPVSLRSLVPAPLAAPAAGGPDSPLGRALGVGRAVPGATQNQSLGFVAFADADTLLAGGLGTPVYRLDLRRAAGWLTRPAADLLAETVRLTGLRPAADGPGLVPDERNRFARADGR